ncbi:MAG TPA: hypothetical protein VF540_10645, partial [Segetibacter sp.]
QKSAVEKTMAVLNDKKENGNNVKYSTVNKSKQEKDNATKLKKIKIQAVAVNVKKAKSIKEMPLALLETVTPNSKPEEAGNNIKDFDVDSKSNLINDTVKNNVIIVEPLVKEDPPLVTSAVYLETNHDDEDKSIYIGAAAINKNKFKGLLRKAAVFLDKKLRPDDN